MITIIFTVLLFAVYRLATGGVEVVERSAPLPSSPAAALATIPAAPVNPQNVANDMQKLLNGSNAQAKEGQQPVHKDSSDLNEIEKALGLTK